MKKIAFFIALLALIVLAYSTYVPEDFVEEVYQELKDFLSFSRVLRRVENNKRRSFELPERRRRRRSEENTLSDNACGQCWNGGWNFGDRGTTKWCTCCRNDCGGFQGQCRNQGYGSHFCVAPPPQQGQFCQCVAYIVNKFRMSCGHAKDYPNCYGQGNSSPRVGGVVVFLPCHQWADKTYGHIAEVLQVTSSQILIRGTNHGGNTFTANGCNNVADVWWPRNDACSRYY